MCQLANHPNASLILLVNQNRVRQVSVSIPVQQQASNFGSDEHAYTSAVDNLFEDSDLELLSD